MDKLSGLNNIGNTCYLNSAMQLVINCTVLSKVILTHNFDNKALNIYKSFLIDYKKNKVVNPIIIKNLVGNKIKKFLNNNQHDAHEFLIYLIEILEEGFKNEYKNDDKMINNIKLNSLVSTIFDTTVSSIIYSEETNEKTKNRVGEKILSIPIPNTPNPSLNDCLNLFSEIEKLEGDSKWKSEKENKLVNAYKRLYLKSLPKYLIIQLKRFSFFSFSNKNNKDINVPINLNINESKYSLRGIIYHSGNVNGGHYVSVINLKNKWYLCDDSSISELNDISKYLTRGYIFLFVKQK